MKFMKRTARYTKWNHEWNEDIVKEPKIEPVTHHIEQSKKTLEDKWIEWTPAGSNLRISTQGENLNTGSNEKVERKHKTVTSDNA
jgi:hypothetical protein